VIDLVSVLQQSIAQASGKAKKKAHAKPKSSRHRKAA
jgi:hypothetical protein